MEGERLRRLDSDSILGLWNENVAFLSIGCSVEAIESIDQQMPILFKQKFTDPKCSLRAKLWLFDPKFWNRLPLSLRSAQALHSPRSSAKEFILDLNEDYLHMDTHVYQCNNLQVEVLHNQGQVYISVFTQPYLMVEENKDVVEMYNEMVKELKTAISGTENETNSILSRLHYHHLAEYGTARPEKETLVWKLPFGAEHDQDEALVREVSRFEGNSPTFGCGCYAAYPGHLFAQYIRFNGHIQYGLLHEKVLEEIERRGGREKVLTDSFDSSTNSIKF